MGRVFLTKESMANTKITKDDIEVFLKANARKLVDPEYYFGLDTNQDEPEKYDSAKLRVMVCFLSPGDNRGVANTMAALNWLLHEKVGDQVFVDYCYYVTEANKEIFDKNKIPYEFGCASHRPIRDFDVMILSSAICTECLNIPHLLNSLGIPLTIEERAKDLTVPPIFYGGAAANEQGIILGPIYSKDGSLRGKSLVDMCTYGYGEHLLGPLAEALIKAKGEGVNLKDKTALKEWLITNNILHDIIFYPDKYEWVYADDRFTIKEIKKLDDRLPDRVRYNQIRWTDFDGFPKKIFNVSGENADSHDVMISSGCSGSSSTCSFCHPEGTKIVTDKGLLPIEKVQPGDKVVTESGNWNLVTKLHDMGSKHLVEVTLKNGYLMKSTPCHRVAVYNGQGGIEWKDAGLLTCDDNLIVYRGFAPDTERVCPSGFAEFVGRMVGDGSWNTRFSLFANKDEIEYCKALVDSVGYPYTVREKERSTFEIQISKKQKTDFWPDYTDEGKTIPSDVFGWGREDLLQFLKGLFDSDGTQTKNGDISVATKSLKMAREIQLLLLQVGALSRIDKQTIHWKADPTVGRVEGDQVVYRVFIKDRTSYDAVRGVLFEGGHEGHSNLIVPSTREVREQFIRAGKNLSYIRDRKLSHDNVKQTDVQGVIYDLIRQDKVVVLPVERVELVVNEHCYDLSVENEHSFIADGILSHNCMEATVAGYYRERPLADVVRSMKEVRGWAACNNLSHYSYNMNYYGRFGDLLVETAKIFKHTSLRNERLDVVANAPEQLMLAKRMGLQRFSGAIEGMGDKIRNGLLNKNLPTETLVKAGHNIFALKLMHFKMGCIVTGDETKEDMDEFIREMDLLIAERDKLGAHTSFQQNWTPLVLYSMTPLRWRERKTAKASFLGERNMGYYIEACQKRGIRTKFNGRGPGTWIEQLLMDFGPIGTDWMVAACEKGLSYGRHFNDKNREQVLSALTERKYDPLFFCNERPDDWIFPNDHIIYVTDELKKMWLDRWHKKDFRTPLCLRTLANKEGVKCHGCKQCQSAEEIKSMIARDLNDHSTPDDVMNAFSDNRHVESVQVVVRMKPGFDMWSKDTLSHYITSQFLRRSEECAEGFYGVGQNTFSWASANQQKCWVGGTWVYDLELKERGLYQKFVDLIPEVNKVLKTCQVVRIHPDTKTMAIKRNDWVSYVGFSKDCTAAMFKERMNAWDGKTTIAVKGMGGMVDTEKVVLPEVTINNFSAVQGAGGVYVHFSVPAFVNPALLLSGILSKKYELCLEQWQFNTLDHAKEIDGNCQCGRHLGYSFVTGQSKRFCQTCEGRAFLKKITTKA